MLRVARIRPAGRREDLRAVVLVDGRRFLVDAAELESLALVPEAPVEEALERHLAALDEGIRAREAALRLLRYRLRSRLELVSRLRRRRFRPATIEAVVADLTARGMVDDARFAQVWAEHRALANNGPQRVRAELRGKGVASSVIDEAVRSVFAGQEAELAAALAERARRRLRNLPVDVRLRRLAGLLRRHGFSGSVITPLLRREARPERNADVRPDPAD